MSALVIIGLLVVGVVSAIVISGRLRRRRENEGPHERGDRLQRNVQQFSRRLVSEIKLYNESRVADGRKNHDLYDQLREEIDRSRKTYDKASGTFEDRDYFHDAVVEILCDGDPNVLGADYPGPRAPTIQ